jgi:glutaredoxin
MNVILYSTPLCAPCEQLKRYLTAKGVAFTVKDLLMDEEAAELMDSLNIRSAPALGIAGKVYAGAELDPDRIEALLARAESGL